MNSDYKTVYCNKHNKTYADMIDCITYSTQTKYIKWEKKYDSQGGLWYWFGEDKEYKERYYFYIDNPVCGSVLQIVSDKEQRNFDLDDMSFPTELKKLAEAVTNKPATSTAVCTIDDYYNKYYGGRYGSCSNYGCGSTSDYYTSYKELKRQKADKQLKTVEPTRNFETL